MTNLEYSFQLVNELKIKKSEAEKTYEQILNSKNGSVSEKANLYLKQVDEFQALANSAESIMRNLLSGSMLPTDQISV